MHVCLAVTPFFYFERIHPPLALGYMTAIAKQRGHSCDTHDLRMRLERDVDAGTRTKLRSYGMIYFEPKLPSDVLEIMNPHVDKWAEEIASKQPRVLGVSCFRPTRVASMALALAVKKRSPDTVVVFGGPDCTLYYQEILECPAVDAVVVGDGEEAWAGLLDAIEDGEGLSDVPNLYFRADSNERSDTPVRTAELIRLKTPGRGPSIKQSTVSRRPPVSALVIPDFDGLPIPEYFASRPDKPPILPILWQRGCVQDCTFCNARTFFPTVHARTPESILEEMHSHYSRYGVRVFEFYDLSLNNYPGELTRFCELNRASPVAFQWFGMMRFTRALTEDFIKMMAAAGLIRASFGMESGSPSVLKHMRKNTNMQLVADILRHCHQNGIDTHVTLIVGYPTETEEDFQETVRFLKENQESLSSVNTGSTCSIKSSRPLWEMRDKLGIKFDEDGEWYLGDNTIKVRLDRLARLNAAVEQMTFKRSYRFDAWTEELARRAGVPSPNVAFEQRNNEVQVWPVRTVSLSSATIRPERGWSVGEGDAC